MFYIPIYKQKNSCILSQKWGAQGLNQKIEIEKGQVDEQFCYDSI